MTVFKLNNLEQRTAVVGVVQLNNCTYMVNKCYALITSLIYFTLHAINLNAYSNFGNKMLIEEIILKYNFSKKNVKIIIFIDIKGCFMFDLNLKCMMACRIVISDFLFIFSTLFRS